MQPNTANSDKHSYWNAENIVRAITLMIAVLGFIYGIYQFTVQNERQYKQKIYESQLELYKQVMDLSSNIATSHYSERDSTSFKGTSRRFDQLFFGQMLLFEDTGVEKAMIAFKIVKDDYISKRPEVTIDTVQNVCFKLGYACRNSLQKTWGLNVEVLNRK